MSRTQTAEGGRSGSPALAIRDLTAAYRQGVDVLSDVNIDVASGEVVAIIGANGAGKTTLVRAATGLLPYYGGGLRKGSVDFFGALSPAQVSGVVRAGVSHVLEGRHVFPDLTVAENLRAGAITVPARAISARYADVMDRFPSLKRRESTAAGYLSGGEQQMLAIGRALMQNPKVLLLDEPTLGLAPAIVTQIRDLIVELNDEGTTVLLIEQNVAMALQVSHRCYIMERGRIVREGLSADLAEDDSIRQAYLGVSEVDS